METGSLIIALLFMGVGLIAGVLAALIITGGGKKEPAADNSRSDEYQPEASLVRDSKSGRLAVELDGKVLTNSQRLTGEQRQKVEKLAAELVRWLGIQPAAQPSAVESTTARMEPSAQPAAPSAPVVAPTAASVPVAKRAPTSIVEQIDEVLQELLTGTQLAERSIHISEGPQQSVVVWIGAQRYNGIDAVPDPQVKAAIRAAVSEWERRAAKNSPSGQ